MSTSKQPPPRLPSKDDLAQLTHFSSLLHLLHHRNKNQHRRSPWYRHFSLFRRNLNAVLEDYTTLSSTSSTALERTRLKAQTPKLHARITQRLAFWQNVLVARWTRAFSQVVADGRFSVLGLVMLGVLSGVCKVVGIMDGLEAEGQAEIERVLEEFGREAWGDGDGGFGVAVARGEDGDEDGGTVVARVDEGEPVARKGDVREVVAREEGDDQAYLEGEGGTKKQTLPPGFSEDEAEEVKALPRSPPPAKVAKSKTASTKKRTTTETKPKPLKKKRKKGCDAIDDLFSGW